MSEVITGMHREIHSGVTRRQFLTGNLAVKEKETGQSDSFLEIHGPYEIGRHRLNVVGVVHQLPTLENYREKLTELVSQSPFVILEYLDNQIRRRAEDTLESQDSGITPNSIGESTTAFFAGLARICADSRKDIIVVNPQSEATEILQQLILYGIPIGLIFASMNLRRGLSRRHFIALTATTIPAILEFDRSFRLTRRLRNMLENVGIGQNNLQLDEEANLLGWNHSDYRDLKSAIGIRKALQIYDSEASRGEIPIIQGAWHNGIAEYMKNPDLVEQKLFMYPHYQLLGTNSLRRYTYNQGKNAWELREELPF